MQRHDARRRRTFPDCTYPEIEAPGAIGCFRGWNGASASCEDLRAVHPDPDGQLVTVVPRPAKARHAATTYLRPRGGLGGPSPSERVENENRAGVDDSCRQHQVPLLVQEPDPAKLPVDANALAVVLVLP
jgi:hypothetical protein